MRVMPLCSNRSGGVRYSAKTKLGHASRETCNILKLEITKKSKTNIYRYTYVRAYVVIVIASNLFVRDNDERDAECFKLHFDITNCLRYTRKKFVKTIACKRSIVDGRNRNHLLKTARKIVAIIHIHRRDNGNKERCNDCVRPINHWDLDDDGTARTYYVIVFQSYFRITNTENRLNAEYVFVRI